MDAAAMTESAKEGDNNDIAVKASINDVDGGTAAATAAATADTDSKPKEEEKGADDAAQAAGTSNTAENATINSQQDDSSSAGELEILFGVTSKSAVDKEEEEGEVVEEEAPKSTNIKKDDNATSNLSKENTIEDAKDYDENHNDAEPLDGVQGEKSGESDKKDDGNSVDPSKPSLQEDETADASKEESKEDEESAEESNAAFHMEKEGEEDKEVEGEVNEESIEEAGAEDDKDATGGDKDDQTEEEEDKSGEKEEGIATGGIVEVGKDEKTSEEEGGVVGEGKEEVEEGEEVEDQEEGGEGKDVMPYSTRRRRHQQKEAVGPDARGGTDLDKSSYRDTSEQDVDSELGVPGRSSAVEPEIAAGTGGSSGATRSGAAALSSTSFLEALTEEERRTRTRFLPEVEGIRMLYKHEVKSDLELARSIVSSGGVPGTLKKSARGRKPKHQQQDGGDKMDLDEESEDGASDSSSRHNFKMEFMNKDFVAPCSTFVVPPESFTGSVNGDNVATSSSTIGASSKNLLVESITAFNPPRNPESIGAKKKHRMMRWEQQPQDVEVDLNKYRKTVKKTREELHREEREQERIEVVGSILRRHCLNHLDALADESHQINEELSMIQTQCVKAADLLTSRKRSHGAGKVGYAMRDVLSVLKTRIANLKVLLPVKAQQEKIGSISKGLGGVSAISFKDWGRSTANIEPIPLAEAWILPGDKVQTPYGEGVAIHAFGPCVLDVNASPLDEVRPEPASKTPSVNKTAGSNFTTGSIGIGQPMNIAKRQGPGTSKVTGSKVSEITSAGGRALKNGKPKQTDCLEKGTNELHQILAPRVCVRLSFGLGFFAADQVTSKEDPSSYSDSMLAARWKNMVETANFVGASVDIAGMEFASGKREMDMDDGSGSKSVADSDRMDDVDNHYDSAVNESGDAMQDDANGGRLGQKSSTSQAIIDEKKATGKRLFPFGSGMLPTACGRGALYPHAEITALETGIHSCLFDGGGVVGTKDNRGVPEGAREWEDQRYGTIQLQAKVRQLRNELNRQHRIRLLNESTFSTVKDQSHHVKNLVKEMKSDLKNLKDRLQDEVTDLGIEEDEAQSLLAEVYAEQEKLGSSNLGTITPKGNRKSVTKESFPVIPKNTPSCASDVQEGSDPNTAVGDDAEEYRDGGRLECRMSAEDDTGANTSDPETGDEDLRAKRSRLAPQ